MHYRIGEMTRDWAIQHRLDVGYETTLGSTNDWAKREAFQNLPSFKLYVAETQTAGRGREQRTWTSPTTGTALFSSWSFQLDRSPQHLTAPIFGWGLFQAVKEVWPQKAWSLKAPNDLYLDDKKVGGLLLEILSEGSHYRLIAGLGLNVLDFPHDVELAGAISEPAAFDVHEWNRFLRALILRWHHGCEVAVFGQFDDETCRGLKEALNAHPRFKEHFVDVRPNGDFVTKTGTVSWKDI